MKKFLAVFLALLLTSFISCAYAEAAASHRHCVCGVQDCEENHEETGTVDWTPWNGDTSVGTADDSSDAAIYLYLENDVTIKDTLDITNVTVFLCLNGKTLTIDKEGYPAVRTGANQKFVLCDCQGNGKITGAKGSAENDKTRFGAVNCQSGSSFVMYGGSIAGNEILSANGGGIYLLGGTFTMHGGSVTSNKVPNGSGGAISAENGKIIATGGEMTGNSAINGGALHLKGSASANLRNIIINGNTAANNGGAINGERGTGMNIYDSELGGNTAQKYGGAVYVNSQFNPTYNIYDSDTHDNYAGENGGAIYVGSSASMQLYGGSVSNNSCEGDGGAVYLGKGTNFNIYNYDNPLYIRGNTANRGGAIYAYADMLTLNGKCLMENNSARSYGGGVYIAGSYRWLIFRNITITKNTAQQGGGIYLNKDNTGYDLEICQNTTVLGNTSSADGSPNNLYLNNGRMFQFRKGLTGSERVGVSVSETPTLDEPVDIEWVFLEQYHADGDHSDLIIPDNDAYEVIYKNNSHWLIPKTKTYTVTFDPNNGEEPQIAFVEEGGTVSGFDYPTRDGYTFDAWYVNGAAYNFETPVTGDLTLTARWIPSDDTALAVTQSKIVVFRLNEAASLFVASYGETGLIDVKKIELNGDETEEYIAVFESGLDTENAAKISAFLWKTSASSGGITPLCESAAAGL